MKRTLLIADYHLSPTWIIEDQLQIKCTHSNKKNLRRGGTCGSPPLSFVVFLSVHHFESYFRKLYLFSLRSVWMLELLSFWMDFSTFWLDLGGVLRFSQFAQPLIWISLSHFTERKLVWEGLIIIKPLPWSTRLAAFLNSKILWKPPTNTPFQNFARFLMGWAVAGNSLSRDGYLPVWVPLSSEVKARYLL